jgi:hypothetical protein
MKTIKILAVIFFLSGITVIAQNLWKTEVPLNFSIQPNTKVSSFVDENGIHIVYFRNGGIRYALANSQGGVIKYDKVIESEGSGADFANVVANGNNVFAVYHKANKIRVARSTNLGESWNTTFSSFDLINTDCNKIVAYRDGSNIKITWSERRIGSSNNDVHFVDFNTLNQSWSAYKRVSENESGGGDNPDFAFTTEKLFVNYITSIWQPINRDRNTDGSWNNSEPIPFNQFPMSNRVVDIKPFIIGNEINTLYKNSWSGMTNGGVIIGHSYKALNNTNWIQDPNYLETDYLSWNTIYPHVAAKTSDGKIHLIYFDKNQSSYSYRNLINHSFSNHLATIYLSNYLSNCLVSNSNDLYLIRTDNISSNGNILLRQYDAAPLAPQNPQLSSNPGNNKVRISWTRNNEADIASYEIWRKVAELGGVWQNIGTTTNNYFVDNEYLYAPGAGDFTLTYKIRAKDIGNHYSEFSQGVTTRGEYLGKEYATLNTAEFKLNDNYPNPFNPTTKISWQSPVNGQQTLKVYDVLGREVATLVDEYREAGSYEIEFDATNLPSGMYIYRLQSGSYSNVKKMILSK